MQETKKEHIFWDAVAKKSSQRPYLAEVLGEYKRDELKRVIHSWVGQPENRSILKTDLFEEALGCDQLLFNTFEKNRVFGMDISRDIVNKAGIRARGLKRACYFNTADARALPYKDGVFDIIISNSTLDHLKKSELAGALLELKRVLKTGGKIILTLNNRHNLNFHFFNRLGVFLGLIYFPVEFYTIDEVRAIVGACGLRAEDTVPIIHLVSPVNKILVYSRPILGRRLTDCISRLLVKLAKYLGQRKNRFSTGWFLAFLVTKGK